MESRADVDHVLNAIDHCLGDDVSRDAMRCTWTAPEPEVTSATTVAVGFDGSGEGGSVAAVARLNDGSTVLVATADEATCRMVVETCRALVEAHRGG